MEKSLETLTRKVNDLTNQAKPVKKRKRPSGAQRQKKKKSRNCDATSKGNSDAFIADIDGVTDDNAVAEMISESRSTAPLSPII